MLNTLASVWRSMRDASLLAAAWVYMSDVSKKEDVRVREVRGLLMLIASEVRSNERVLEKVSENSDDPFGLLDSSYLSEEAWKSSRVYLTSSLFDYGLFSMISTYYERLHYLTIMPRLFRREELGDALRIAEGVKEHGAFVRRMIHDHMALLSSRAGK